MFNKKPNPLALPQPVVNTPIDFNEAQEMQQMTNPQPQPQPQQPNEQARIIKAEEHPEKPGIFYYLVQANFVRSVGDCILQNK